MKKKAFALIPEKSQTQKYESTEETDIITSAGLIETSIYGGKISQIPHWQKFHLQKVEIFSSNAETFLLIKVQ